MRDMSNYEQKAKDFAILKHGDQQYSTGPYSVHLQAVVDVLFECGYSDPFHLAGGWLHDVLEDTDANQHDFIPLFGPDLHKAVLAVSGFGHNRKTRNGMIYDNLTRHPEFCWLKVADRIANVEASVNNPSKAKMYVDEHDRFCALVKGHVPDAMFDRYCRAIEAVR